VGALTAMELRLAARRGENVLVTLVIPVAVLLFFGGTAILPIEGDVARTLVPGTIALAIVAAGLVNLGIATAYERHYGVLKRLGAAPLPRWGFLAAKLLAILVIEAVQVVLVIGVANIAFQWVPGEGWSPALVVAALLLGTVSFVSLGLLLAGTLRAEAVLALANGLFLALLMLGGIVLPLEHLPDVVRPVAAYLPSAALADMLRWGLDPSMAIDRVDTTRALLVLAGWSIVTPILAVRRFRWD
jgi:ABC-2 type transport system permease protein